MTDQTKIIEVGQGILELLLDQDPTRAQKAKHLFTLILSRESRGFVLDPALEAKLRRLPDYSPEEFEDEVASLGLEVLDAVLTHDETLSPPPPEPMVNATQVFDHLAKANPFFQRWLEFRSKLPASDPEAWDEFADEGVAEEEQDYARAMRELGHMLINLIQRKKQIAEYIATGLMNSHLLKGDDRYWNTVAWVYMAEEDAEK
jgi:hypothetical protein